MRFERLTFRSPRHTLDFHSKHGGNAKRAFHSSAASSSGRSSIISVRSSTIGRGAAVLGENEPFAIITIKPTAARSGVNYSTPRVRAHVVSHKGKCLEADGSSISTRPRIG